MNIKQYGRGLWVWLLSIKPQVAIAIFCIGLVIARFIWPGLKFDNLSLDLILIAMLCILVPNLAALIARIKKFKFGDKEIELNEALDKITRQTENIEDEIASSPGTQFQRTEGPPSHIERYVSDPRGGLIAISADIEKKVLQLLRGQKLDETKRYVTPTKGIEILAQYGRVVQDLPILMRDFWIGRSNDRKGGLPSHRFRSSNHGSLVRDS